MKKLYIAGPMTGLPGLNFPTFIAEAKRLRAEGWDVVSPVELNQGLEHEGWNACMRRDLAALAHCDAIHMLPGWQNSRGARLEFHVAYSLGLRAFVPELAVEATKVAA